MSLILLLQNTVAAASSTASSTDSAADFGKRISDLAGILLDYLAPLAGIGVVSMALIELVKKLLDSRTKFHARHLIRWMISAYDPKQPANTSALQDALTDLLQLCTGTSAADAREGAKPLIANGRLPASYALFSKPRAPVYAVFGLELERMMGSIQEAADTVLSNPRKHEQLYLFLTQGARDGDQHRWLGVGKDERGKEKLDGPSALAEVAQKETPEARATIKDLSELSARLRQIVKGKLDGFQLYTSDSWANWNQLWANLVGIVLMSLTLWFAYPVHHAWMILFAVIGGILAPVAKDLVSALQNLKNG